MVIIICNFLVFFVKYINFNFFLSFVSINYIFCCFKEIWGIFYIVMYFILKLIIKLKLSYEYNSFYFIVYILLCD